MPLKVNFERETYILGPNPDSFKNWDGVTIYWSGDDSSKSKVWQGSKQIGDLTMPEKGFITEVEYNVTIPPVEKNGEKTTVTKHVGLERL